MRKGFLLREHDYAYIQYGEDATGGIELFDMRTDPQQYTNLADNPDYRHVVARLKAKMTAKLGEIRNNDLPIRGLGRRKR
jgi:iduronate 2-sulfatase